MLEVRPEETQHAAAQKAFFIVKILLEVVPVVN